MLFIHLVLGSRPIWFSGSWKIGRSLLGRRRAVRDRPMVGDGWTDREKQELRMEPCGVV